MKKTVLVCVLLIAAIVLISAFTKPRIESAYQLTYHKKVIEFRDNQQDMLDFIDQSSFTKKNEIDQLIKKIHTARLKLKGLDFWFRYLDPIVYKKINGPLPVEWETEVFEKFEAPYKREGAGLTLAELYVEEENFNKDSLRNLVSTSVSSTVIYLQDSITRNLSSYHHFFLANRLFLLNLASIYTTGFECPDSSRIVPELQHMLESVTGIYAAFNETYPQNSLDEQYYSLFEKTISFVKSQPAAYSLFDHFTFIQKYINPLFALNQQMIIANKVRSNNFNDYSLSNYASGIFEKSLYEGQNEKGVYIAIDNKDELNELAEIGRLLFYDPILSLNNKRSCASCHKPAEFFTDTLVRTHDNLDQQGVLPRNTPSLLNTIQNHLVMLDGKHINLENQCKAVITNPAEMGSTEESVIKKVMSCEEYKSVFKKYLHTTPQYNSINLEHIASAIMLYYTQFSKYYSPFDNAMNEKKEISADIKNGFNLFMSKAQCGTCHFVPQFNGTKPPYIGSEFEVIGVPADTSFTALSPDLGRYLVNPAKETRFAFRTGTVRNAAVTKPYMHNGVFTSLEQVINFYDAGGGAGRGLTVNNQTLSSDSLKLTSSEKKNLIVFINSLTEEIPLQHPPLKLPFSKNKELNKRTVGGEY